MGKQADARQTLTAMHSHLFACVSEQAAEIASDGYSTDGGLLRAKARYDEMSAEYQAVGAALKAIDDNARIAAERDQLRAEVDDWKQHLAIEVERSAAAESTVAGLRRALEEIQGEVKAFDHDGQGYEDEPNACASDDCPRCAIWHGAENALAASPAEHARRIKAEAQALEALHWWFDEDHEPQREAVRIKRDEAGIRWTSDQWIAAVLEEMEKEKG